MRTIERIAVAVSAHVEPERGLARVSPFPQVLLKDAQFWNLALLALLSGN